MIVKEKIKKEILSIIFKHLNPNNCTIFLFGSYAQNKAKQSSDIDIGFVSTEKVSLNNILTIKEELNEVVNVLRDIDFVDFSADNLDKDFIRIALRDIEIWHKTKESSKILNNLLKP